MAAATDRRHARVEFRTSVRVARTGAEWAVVAHSLNLSETGIFVASADVCGPGCDVVCDMPLGERRLSLHGRVVWVRPHAAPGAPRGMGIRFVDLTVDDTWHLRKAVIRARKTHPMDGVVAGSIEVGPFVDRTVAREPTIQVNFGDGNPGDPRRAPERAGATGRIAVTPGRLPSDETGLWPAVPPRRPRAVVIAATATLGLLVGALIAWRIAGGPDLVDPAANAPAPRGPDLVASDTTASLPDGIAVADEPDSLLVFLPLHDPPIGARWNRVLDPPGVAIHLGTTRPLLHPGRHAVERAGLRAITVRREPDGTHTIIVELHHPADPLDVAITPDGVQILLPR